jgi:hypothetical protein
MLPNRKNLRGALHTSSVRTATSANQYDVCRPNTLGYGRLAQLGERLPYKQEVLGSSPGPPTHRVPL